MLLQILVLRDDKSDGFGVPQFVASVGIGTRAFMDAINGSEASDLSKHPEDFTLYHVGEYDDSSCSFNLFPQPKFVVAGNTIGVRKQ